MCVLLKIIFNKSKNMRVVLYSTIFLILLAFSPWNSEPFELAKLMLLVAVPAIVLFFWFVRQVLKGEVTFWRTPLDIPLLLLLLVTGASFFFSEDTPYSLFGTQGRFHDGIMGTLGFAVMYFFVTQALAQKEGKEQAFPWQNAMRVFVGAGAVLALLQYAALFKVENANVFPLETLVLLFAVLAVFLIGRGGMVFGFVPDILLLVSFLGLLFLSSSFSAWLVLFLGLCTSLFVSVWNRVRLKEPFSLGKLWLPLGLAVFSLVFLWAFIPKEYSLEKLSSSASWNIAWNTGTDSLKNAFIGSGPGTSQIAISQFRSEETNKGSPFFRFEELENHASQVLAAMGFLGAFAWALVFLVFLLFAFFLRSPFLAMGFGLFASQFFFPSSTLMLFVSALVLGLGASTLGKLNYSLVLSLKKFFEVRVAFFALLAVFLGLIIFYGPWMQRWFSSDMLYAKSLKTNDENFVLKAQELNPKQTDYKLFAGTLLFEKVLKETENKEKQQDAAILSLRVQQALALLQEASNLSPKRVEVWEALGRVYGEISFAPGALDWASQSLERAIMLEPVNPLLYTRQSALLRKKEKLSEARKALNKALSLQPNLKEALLENILLLEQEGKKEQALSVAKELILRFPNDTKILFELGRMYFNNQEWKIAAAKFEQLLKLEPNNSDARYSLALALEKQGDKKGAIRELERVLELNPGKEEVLQELEELKKR